MGFVFLFVMNKIKTFKPKEDDEYFYVSIPYCCHAPKAKVMRSIYHENQDVEIMGNNCYRTRREANIICDRLRKLFDLPPLYPQEPVQIY